jgi:hypothetical protein
MRLTELLAASVAIACLPFRNLRDLIIMRDLHYTGFYLPASGSFWRTWRILMAQALLSVEQAAERLGGVSKWTIYSWISQRKLIKTKIEVA